MVLDAQPLETSKVKILIISDGRAGHLNQAIAFAKLKKLEYDIITIENKLKALTYILDFLGIYINLFSIKINGVYSAVVSAGSATYYTNKYLAKKLKIKSISLMLPKGYRRNFDFIFAQSHDNPPVQKNIIEIPANFSFIEPQGLFVPHKKAVGVIIGGDNAIFTMETKRVKKQLDFIFEHFQDYEIAITTSPRTSTKIEELIQNYAFSYTVIYSQNKINPIADFLKHCEFIFITIDSTSMISEAVSYGDSFVEVLPIDENHNNKFYKMTHKLEKAGYLHIFDGKIEAKNKKIDFKKYIEKLKDKND